MNALLEAVSRKAETVDLDRGDIRVANKAHRNPLNHDSALPLWVEARAHAIGFRHADLVRAHWKKIRRSMLDD